MYKIGDFVFDKNNNDRVQIVDVSTVWGFLISKAEAKEEEEEEFLLSEREINIVKSLGD